MAKVGTVFAATDILDDHTIGSDIIKDGAYYIEDTQIIKVIEVVVDAEFSPYEGVFRYYDSSEGMDINRVTTLTIEELMTCWEEIVEHVVPPASQ